MDVEFVNQKVRTRLIKQSNLTFLLNKNGEQSFNQDA